MIHNLEMLRASTGADVVDFQLKLCPFVKAAKLKTGAFAAGSYLGFDERHDKLLAALEPAEHERARVAMLVPTLSLNCLYEPSPAELKDYDHYFRLVSGDLGGPKIRAPEFYLEGVSFEIKGSMLRQTAKPLSKNFRLDPIPQGLRSAFGSGAVRFVHDLPNGILMSLMFSKGPHGLGELAVSSFLEKDGKGAPIEPWNIFNFPAGWKFLPSQAVLSERIDLMFQCCNFFCDVIANEFSH